MNLSDYIDQTNAAETPEALFSALETAARKCGYAHVAYAHLTSPPVTRDNAPLLNYPADWARSYVTENCQEIDPIVAWTAQIAQPYLWRDLGQTFPLSPAQRMFMTRAAQAGLTHGLTIPLHGPWGDVAGVSYAGRRQAARCRALLSRLQLAAHQFHHCVTRLRPETARHAPALSLSARERDCLHWIARGKTSWETGVILGLQASTIDTYLRKILHKLDVSTRAMAVLKAARLGLIMV